ncbi:sensor histidine kinase [Salana multivorans]
MADVRSRSLLGWFGRAVRAGIHLVLGGVIAAGYAVLVSGIVQLVQAAPAMPIALSLVIAVIAVPIALAPPLVAPVRDVGIAAARILLDVDLPIPTASPTWDDRLRSAGYFVAHLLIGGAAVVALLFGVPFAVGLIGWALGVRADAFQISTPDLGWWGIPVGALVLAMLPPLALLGGAVLRSLAVPLLGPSTTACEEEERRRRVVLAERNRIARDLHDGVGHALAVTTMQASVAEAALSTGDDAAVRAALTEIARVGRGAMADLDRSLAVLREDDRPGTTTPAPALTDLEALRERAASVGRELRLDGDVRDLDGLDPLVSREAHRLLTEAVVNAGRHGSGPIELHWARRDDRLVVDVRNRVRPGARVGRTGRGLVGMRERATLIGADLTPGPDGEGGWTVRLTIPGDLTRGET